MSRARNILEISAGGANYGDGQAGDGWPSGTDADVIPPFRVGVGTGPKGGTMLDDTATATIQTPEEPKKEPASPRSLALKVHDSLRRDGVLDRFQHVIVAWSAARRQQLHDQEAWRNRRQEFFESFVGPPCEDWRSEPYHLGSQLCSRVYRFPPDLASDAEPSVDSPLCFSVYHLDPVSNRAMSLEAKYAACAALHDVFFAEITNIDPWGNADDFRLGLAYAQLCDDMKQLADEAIVGENLFGLEAIVGDVLADLAEVPSGPMGNGQGAASIGDHAANPVPSIEKTDAPSGDTATRPAGNARSAAEKRETQTTVRISKEAQALAVLVDHRDWSNQQIADVVGCHVKTLNKWQKFTDARKAIKESGKAAMPTGNKNGDDGTVEAWG